ncbi:MAG: undecaprenyl-phosphate glucose phosphotransferase [Betaproteobacteria bacterium RIFCSPLOWO2_02_FULL_63_19]|nr:MAG: undecaprenyl-phosphate glucose phosphotransferase [Betaproteobacteria bacterium RIFCSPLOWO2_02_FULL_63_19]
MASDAGGLIRPHASKFAFLHRLLDSAVVFLSLFGAVAFYDPQSMGPYYWLAAVLAVLVFVTAGELTHLYSSWRVYALRQEVAELAAVCAGVAALLVTIAYLTKTSEHYSRVIMILWWSLSFSILVILRFAIRLFLRASRANGRNMRSLAIAGAGDLARRVAERVLAAEWLGLNLIGFYDDDVHRGVEPLAGHPYRVEGSLATMVERARSGNLDYVYVALPLVNERRVMDLIRELSDTTASVFLVPEFFMFEMMNARWTEIEGMPVVSIFDTPFLGVDGSLKRLEDIALAGLILIPALPLMLLVALAIKLTSRGPVLFVQHRYGMSGKVVEVWKFRTMKVLEDGGDVPQARKADPRVTRFGAFLRRTSLDELPQFFNVLQGHMSVVGPRPHAVSHNEQYRKLVTGYMLRHKVKPGITGWAQVNGWRGETDTVEKMRKRVEHDLYYIRNWSIWLDLKIVFLTVVRGFTQPAAY